MYDTTTGNDTRWSSKLARSSVTEARRTARRQRQVSDEGGGKSATKPQGNNVPFSAEKQGGRVQWFIRESPLDKCLRESLSEVDKGLWETPNQTTDRDQDQKSRLNEVRLKAQLYQVYRVYIGQRP